MAYCVSNVLFPELGTWLNKADKVPAVGRFHLLGEMSKPTQKSISVGDTGHEEKQSNQGTRAGFEARDSLHEDI